MTVVRWPGKNSGAFVFDLDFLLHFFIKKKVENNQRVKHLCHKETITLANFIYYLLAACETQAAAERKEPYHWIKPNLIKRSEGPQRHTNNPIFYSSTIPTER